jgi:hypothetical protein
VQSTGESVDLKIMQSHVLAALEPLFLDDSATKEIEDKSTKEVDEWSLELSFFINGEFMSSNNRAGKGSGTVSTFFLSEALEKRLDLGEVGPLRELPSALAGRYGEILDCQSGDISKDSSPLSCDTAARLGRGLCWALGGTMALASGSTGPGAALGVALAGGFANECSEAFTTAANTCNASCECRCECSRRPTPSPTP